MGTSDINLFHDLFTGVLLVMGIAIVLIAVSAVINQVADIYDRADTFSDLYAAGADPQLLHRALVRAVMAPAIWVSLLAGGLGLLLVLPWPEPRSCSNRSPSSRSCSQWSSASASSVVGCS